MSAFDISQLHFLRPLFLLAIIPLLMLAYYFWRQKSSAQSWQGAIDRSLLKHLLENSAASNPRWPWLLLAAAWLIGAIALAGPSWNKLPQPVHQQQDALVIVLDLSLSMYAEDIKPSRLIRARHKVMDVLEQRKEGLTGLVVYSGDAHTVSPLTDDVGTISNMLPALAPDIMPEYGSNPLAGFQHARELFKNSALSRGRILFITDEIAERDISSISKTLPPGIELSILGVGTDQGAPIPARNGFIKDNSGKIVVPQLHAQRLQELAQLTGGRYSQTSLDNSDLDFLLPKLSIADWENTSLVSDRQFDQWQDRGPLLALLLLPLALLAFRRGWLLLLPLCFILHTPNSYALNWDELWSRPDQLGATEMAEGNHQQAAEHFQNPDWQGSANYRAGNYQAAAEDFSQQADSAAAQYNLGNSLARAGKLEEAIAAYERALSIDADMEDAAFNKQLLEQLQQQQNQDQQQQQEQQGGSGEQGEQSQQADNAQGGDSQGDASEDSESQTDDAQGGDSSSDNTQSDGTQADSSQTDDSQADDSQTDSASNDDQQRGDSDIQQQLEQQQEQQAQQQQAAANQTPEDDGQQAEQSAQQQQDQQQEKRDEQQQSDQAAEGEGNTQAQLEPELSPEQLRQQQATEQWLRQIPDDPAGLLRRKFQYENQLRRQQGQQNQEQQLW